MAVIIVPNGMFGDVGNDGLIEAMLRVLAGLVGDKDDWCDKYGANFENDVFSMRRFCWCEREDCEWCREEDRGPNFWHKKSGLKVWWYKYIGRDMEVNMKLSESEIHGVYNDCIDSIKSA